MADNLKVSGAEIPFWRVTTTVHMCNESDPRLPQNANIKCVSGSASIIVAVMSPVKNHIHFDMETLKIIT